MRISSYEDEKNYKVCIEDDGLGFNAGEFSGDDKHTHIGLFNVNSRLVNMVHGGLSVKSRPGAGTVCVMTIAKNTQEKNRGL